MSSGEAFSTFLFLCIFEVLGGAAVGAFVRTLLRREPPGMSVFFLIWGAGFAGIPLIVGGAMLLTSERPAFFFAQLFVFLAAVGVVALMPSELFDKDADGNLPTAIVGGVMVIFGAAIVLLTLQDGIGLGTLLGAAVGFGGAVVLLRAVFVVLRPA